ncbi:MAG: bifunctional phosphoglucose/phosphomannose isomerase [Candidatus Liptonbacteria bacterium]|nr:bifunctional phosphoglucose/phosphomannose isomerase [Candidatus Liptonbacteria bacterium]
MYEAIRGFAKQFEFEPRVVNDKNWKKFKKFIVSGMGGSHLAADLLKAWQPTLNLYIHKDYGLPPLTSEDLKNSLIIASSYSGDTEEAISVYDAALKNNLPLAAIASGGKLLDLAKKNGIPYIKLPDIGIEPRVALGFSIKAILKLFDDENGLKEAQDLAVLLRPMDLEKEGQKLASMLKGKVPIIYSSTTNLGLAYNWKIAFNETGKIPAFYNVFPELNHNEMTSFDVAPPTKALSSFYHFLILKDSSDGSRILKRMEVMERIFRDRKFPVTVIELKGESKLHKIFNSFVLANWSALYTAKEYGVDPEEVPLVEEFKKLI